MYPHDRRVFPQVIAALGRAGFRGPPRDLRAVAHDRLRAVLRVLAASARPAAMHARASGGPSLGKLETKASAGGGGGGWGGGGSGTSLASKIRALTAFSRKPEVGSDLEAAAGGHPAGGGERDSEGSGGAGATEELVINWNAMRMNRDFLLQVRPLEEWVELFILAL
jgi:hypothetical protein